MTDEEVRKMAERAGVKVNFPIGQLGEKPPMNIPDFKGVALQFMWGMEVEWLRVGDKIRMKGKIKDIAYVSGQYDIEGNLMTKDTSYDLHVVADDGYEYVVNPELVLFTNYSHI